MPPSDLNLIAVEQGEFLLKGFHHERQKDPEPLETEFAHALKTSLTPVIASRAPLDWTPGNRSQSSRFFHSGAFSEAHKHWESGVRAGKDFPARADPGEA